MRTYSEELDDMQMKRLLFVPLLALILLSGCASQVVKYSQANRPLAESGAMKWSDYYKGLYTTAAKAGDPGQMLSRINTMILASQSYEAGKISSDQFEYLRREAAAGQAIDDDAADARRRAAFAAAAASFNSAPPAYQVQQPKPLTAPTQYQLAQVPATAPVAATAYFTGRQQQVQTVTHQSGWECEYRYLNQTIVRTFVGTCPSSIQVQ